MPDMKFISNQILVTSNIWDICKNLAWNRTIKLRPRDGNLYWSNPTSIGAGDPGQ
jgi:hypothetical protein